MYRFENKSNTGCSTLVLSQEESMLYFCQTKKKYSYPKYFNKNTRTTSRFKRSISFDWSFTPCNFETNIV